MKKYSATTRGFYDTTINMAWPDDAVDISDEEHARLLTAQQDGSVIRPGKDGRPEIASMESRTLETGVALLAAAVTDHLNAISISLGYDSILSAVSYAEEPAVPKYQNEGKALRAWRSNVWSSFSDQIGIIKDVRKLPTVDALISKLPKFTPPQ